MTEVSQLLQSYSSICVSGPDALTLLQGQFSADLRNMANNQSCAYCDLSGKVGWLFDITCYLG